MTSAYNSESTIIDCLRHGEPEGGRMYRGGGTDHPLSELGWSQMQTSVKEANCDWQAIISSPMKRCKEFAKHLAESNGIPLQVIDNFREAGYGDWEGLTPQEIIDKSEQAYWQFFKDPINCRPQNSESLQSFTPRIQSALNHVLEEYKGQHVLLISHLGVTRAIMNIVLDMPLKSQQLIDLPYAGMIRVINDKKGLRLVFNPK